MAEKDKWATKFRSSLSPKSKSLKPTKIWNLDRFALKVVTLQAVEGTLVEELDLRFLATENGVKRVISSFIELALTDIVNYGLLEKIIHYSFER